MASEVKYVSSYNQPLSEGPFLQQQTGINQPLRLTVPVQPLPCLSSLTVIQCPDVIQLTEERDREKNQRIKERVTEEKTPHISI